MSSLTFLRYLALSARPTGLLFVGALSVGFSLAIRAGLLGLPLTLILLSWLFTYGYILLEHVANGAREPPVLAIEMLNPASEQRPLVQLAVVVAAYFGLRAIARHISSTLAVILEGVALAALPASIGALGIGDTVWQAINPMALWQIARAIGTAYLAMVGTVLLYGFGLTWLSTRDWLPSVLFTAAATFGWLSLFALIGGGLYEAREALGHEPIDTPERRDARREQALQRARTKFLDVIYAQARGGNLAGAWHSIEQELALQGHAFELYDWLVTRLEQVDYPRLTNRLVQEAVTRALARDNDRVLRLVQRRLALDATFRPRSDAETLRVAELARLAGDRATAQALGYPPTA